ncbi:MAG: hypothetical protein HUU47_07405 [Bacteroidetes bacterium]|nr:hypothetical protein [Bacteroidota bacterium]
MKSFILAATTCISLILTQNSAIAQKIHKPTGFIYSGELFEDPDWGWSYNTSENDRILLSKTHKLIAEATKKIIDQPGDYTTSVNDMSFAFDPQKQEESKANGSNCVTCYYSANPNSGNHFQYKYTITLDMVENSESYMKKYKIDDSISKLVLSVSEKRKNDIKKVDEENILKEEMEKLQKEIENIDPSKLDEKKLKEIEEKSKRLQQMGNNLYKNNTISNDTLHAMSGFSFALKSDLIITTNIPLLKSEKELYSSLKNKSGYYYKEISIPGCDFACIYFDMYNKSDELEFSQNPVLIAYIGKTYNSKSEMPKQWVKPFCVRVKYTGNIHQINELYKNIDFTKMRQITN